MRSITIFASLLIAAPLLAQDPPKPAKPPVPRTADGKPDMSGIWQGGGASGLAFAVGSANAKAARPGDAAVAGAPAAVVPSRVKPPYQDWMLPKIQELRDRRNIDDPSARCLLVGVPRITAMPLPIKIIQTKDEITFLYETFHAFRVIPTDGRKHSDDIDPSFLGDSVAHWEGDTLVVDVTGFNDKTWLDGRGHFHSEQLHVVERYRRTPEDTIALDVTMEDPNVMTGPWTIHMTLRHPPRADRVMEYECLENNQDLPHLVGPQGSSK